VNAVKSFNKPTNTAEFTQYEFFLDTLNMYLYLTVEHLV